MKDHIMLECRNIRYDGTCIIAGRKFRYTKAVLSDAEQISEIYERTRIDRANFMTKLHEDSPLCFGQKGGMFIVMNRQEIEAEIASKESFWAVFKDENGNIAGSLWSCMRNDFYKGLPYEHPENCIFLREIVVSSEFAKMNVAKALYVTCAKAFLNAGYVIGYGDLYRVLRFRTEDADYRTDQINVPSRTAMEAIGAKFIEPLPQRDIRLEGLTVTIEPQLFSFDYEKIYELYCSATDHFGITLTGRDDS